MTKGGDRRPDGATPPDAAPATPVSPDQRTPASPGRAAVLLAALATAAGVALAWGLLRGVLDLGVGLLGLAALGGWAIGAILRQATLPAWLAGTLAAGAWAAGLVLTWLVSMAILQGSSRTFPERLEAVPFLDWMSPQFGLLEMAGLVVYVVAALYGARRIRQRGASADAS